MINKDIIIFFYIDDIVICYKKKNEAEAKTAVAGLKTQYTINELEDLKWFLEIHVLQDRAKKLLWLSQELYINKIANQFYLDLTEKLPDTSMIGKLLSNDEISPAFKASAHIYQKKTGFILFAIITIKPDVAFAASQLARFNTNPRDIHHKAADHVI